MSAAMPVAPFRFALVATLVLGAAACSGDQPVGERSDPGAVDAPADAAGETAPAPTQPDVDAAQATASDDMPAVGLTADGNPHTWASAAQIGGSLFAVAQACDHPSAGDREAARAEQRRASESLGVDPDDFMQVLDWAYDQAARKLDGASDEQLAESCSELRELEAMATPDPA